MLDFLSSSYLGFRHASAELGEWPAVVTGRPAVLGGAALADLAAREVAALQGAADEIAAPSTLHLAVDLFTAGFGSDTTLLWDAHLYPVLRMGFGLARRPAERIAPHNPAALRDRIATVDRRPVLVTDGYCIACGRPAPLATYLTLLRPREGVLVVDDTQGLGLFGAPGAGPFGEGGGGTPAVQGVAGSPSLLLVTSLGKAFSAPMAVLAGPVPWMERLRGAPTRVHCSPPAIPAARAALRALHVHAQCGGRLRRRLTQAVRLFRASCRSRGLVLGDGFHPVQTVQLPAGTNAGHVAQLAAAAGLNLAACRTAGAPALLMAITATHQPDQLAQAAATLAQLVQGSVPAAGRINLEGGKHGTA